jgi:hypothetical protein
MPRAHKVKIKIGLRCNKETCGECRYRAFLPPGRCLLFLDRFGNPVPLFENNRGLVLRLAACIQAEQEANQ